MPARLQPSAKPLGRLFWFTLVVLVPSLPLALRYTGIVGLVIYIPLSISFFFLTPPIQDRLAKGQLTWMVIGALIILAASYFLIYPVADSGVIGGGGDRDEALDVATRAVLRGEYPYYEPTYLGNPISPLPGALLLSLPFVLLGDSAYQNLLWFGLFLWAFGVYVTRTAERPLSKFRAIFPVLVTCLLLYPEFLRQIWVGSDLLANSIYLFLAILFLSRARRGWPLIVASLLLGVSLASRAHYLVLLPLLFSFLWRSRGKMVAAGSLLLALLAFLALTLPFYLYDPAGFSPLHAVSRLVRFNVLPPYSGLLPLATLALALILSLGRVDDLRVLSKATVLVLAFPLLVGIVIAWLDTGQVDLDLLGYGVGYASFGLWVLWQRAPQKSFSPAYGPRPDLVAP